MKALLRPALVFGLSIAIAATSLIGSSSVALAANLVVSWTLGPVYAGGPVSLTGTFSGGAEHGPYAVDVDWGDGTSESYSFAESEPCVPPVPLKVCLTVHKAAPYLSAGPVTIVVFLSDPSATNFKNVPLTVLAANQPPTIVSLGVTVGSEGGDSTVALVFADVDALDTHTVSVEWGDGETTTSGTLAPTVTAFDATHVYADTGSYSLVLKLTDSASPAHTVTETRSVSPTNVDPVLGTLSVSPSPVVDHQELTLSGSFTDPGTTETFTLKVVWGDGTSSDESLGTDHWFSRTHAYDAAGPVTITATVTDLNGGTSSSSVDLVVGSSNNAPDGLFFEWSATGANLVVSGGFTDADADDTHTLTMSWGDGGEPTSHFLGTLTTFEVSHVYGASGTYTVIATVTDADLAWTSAIRDDPVIVAAGSAADVLDEMTTLVQSFELDRNTERWLIKKIADVKASLAFGNGQVCSSNGTLGHILAFAYRTLTSEQYTELMASATKLEAAAGCTGGATQSLKVLRAAPVTTTVTPALPQTPAQKEEKDTTPKATTPKDAPTKAKSAKSDFKPAGGRSSH